jgi:hypothetical protein
LKDIPPDIEKARASWKRMAKLWRSVHYCLGVVGIFCSVTAASGFLGTIEAPSWLSPLLSLAAALAFGWLAFLAPSDNALAHQRALSLLEREILKYQHGDKYALKFVIDAKRDGESVISSKNLIGELPHTKA